MENNAFTSVAANDLSVKTRNGGIGQDIELMTAWITYRSSPPSPNSGRGFLRRERGPDTFEASFGSA
jgi:hypothetical protein